MNILKWFKSLLFGVSKENNNDLEIISKFNNFIEKYEIKFDDVNIVKSFEITNKTNKFISDLHETTNYTIYKERDSGITTFLIVYGIFQAIENGKSITLVIPTASEKQRVFRILKSVLYHSNITDFRIQNSGNVSFKNNGKFYIHASMYGMRGRSSDIIFFDNYEMIDNKEKIMVEIIPTLKPDGKMYYGFHSHIT